jgi:putative Holliday junction resolvase
MRYLGIDFGTKKVGLALSDEAGTMGFPRGVVQNDSHLLEMVSSLIAREEVGTVVMGESLDYSGKPNPVLEAAHAFAKELEAVSGVPVVFEPEMLTTQEARRGAEGERLTPRDKNGMVDASAAALILTGYIERHGGGARDIQD